MKRALFLVVVASALAASFLASADDAGVPPAHDGGPSPTVDGGVDAGTPAPGPADGSYRLTDADRVSADVNARVDGAIQALHPSMRDAFRAQLRASLAMPRSLRVARGAETLTLTYDGVELSAPLSGAAVSQRGIEGRPVHVVHREEPATIVQETRNGQFRRTDRLVVDGSGLRLETELRTGLLPRPLQVVASYARATPPTDAGTP